MMSLQTTENIFLQQTGQNDEIVIIGAGLVGLLSSLYFADLGLLVKIFERQPDPRTYSNKNNKSKSINLALSERGINALKNIHLNVDDIMNKYMVEMEGRCLHDKKGHQTIQKYGLTGQAINSIDRNLLNKILLEEAAKQDNIKLFFEYKLINCELKEGLCMFENNGQTIEVKANFIVGADGSYSKVRQEMMKNVKVNYQQEYIDHLYCELNMPPKFNETTGTKEYALNPNYLHIWPRGTYMMIALPNIDFSFTCTLFMPSQKFEQIKTPDDLIHLFESNMSDALSLIGKENLTSDYFTNPKSYLICTKISPMNYRGRAIVLGDAAHSMVPFYGQGMNAGFEDVYKLFKEYKIVRAITKDKKIDHDEMDKILTEYSRKRYLDIVAICKLAMDNYIEMRETVYSLRYRIKKRIGIFLHYLFPSLFIPLYTMVSFSNIPYSLAIQRHRIQDRIVNGVIIVTSGLVLSAICLGIKKYIRVDLKELYQSCRISRTHLGNTL